MHDRRIFLTAALAAAAVAPAFPLAAQTRREWRIAGKRVKTVDIHAHIAPDMSSVIGDTPFQARSQSNRQIPREIDAARIARMDSQGIDVEVLSVNPYWYEMDRDLAKRFIDAQNARLAESFSHPAACAQPGGRPMRTADVQAQAAEWLSREDRGLSPVELAELEQWLQASTLHEVEYLRLQAAWERADGLAAALAPPLKEFAPLSRQRSFAAPLIAAALVACVGSAVYFLASSRSAPAHYTTAVGATQSLRLADGTTVQLNSNTVLRAEISATARSVMLDRGEAYFDVIHDPNRPFIVYAGSKRIRDIGTKFSVFRDGDEVKVVVQEGRVSIETADSPGQEPVLVDAAQAVVTRGKQAAVSPMSEHEVSNRLSWRRGTLVFEDRTLEEAAQEFNRYNAKQLIVDGDAKDMKIGGRFRANNVDSFVTLLHKGFGLNVSDRGTAVIVSR